MRGFQPRVRYTLLGCLFPWVITGVLIGSSGYADSNGNRDTNDLSRSDTPIEFSARLIWHRDGKTSKSQLFVKGDRYRIEHLGGIKTDLGFAGVTIVRLDQRKVWYLYSARRLLLSVPVTREDILPISVVLVGEVKRTLVGDAYVGKRLATLYEVEVLGQSGQREKYFEWVDVERDVLMKLLSQDRDWWVEYAHVVQSKQPEYYFDAPLGYRKVEAEQIPSHKEQ